MGTKPEPRKQPGDKGRAWAIASLVLGILDALFSVGIVQIIWVEESELLIYSVFGPLGNFVILATIVSGLFLAVPFGLFSLIAGLTALSLIKKGATGKKGVWMAAAGIVLGVLGVLLGLLWWYLFSLQLGTSNLY